MMAAPKLNYRDEIAQEIIARIEAGTAPWQKPWLAGAIGAAPFNPVSGKPYRGINDMWLTLQGRADPRWLTYNQAVAEGSQVRKGEKSATIEYWQWTTREPMVDGAGKPVLSAEGKQQTQEVRLDRPRVFYAKVFNAEQIDGLAPWVAPAPSFDPIKRAEAILAGAGIPVLHDQADRAFYQPATDKIHLPPTSAFPNAPAYYETALHELGHATGHPTRLSRAFGPFGSEGYAREELRAEISSYMLARDLGISFDPSNHAAYVESWLKVLREDKNEIFRAAKDAETIKTWVMEPEKRPELERAARQQHTAQIRTGIESREQGVRSSIAPESPHTPQVAPLPRQAAISTQPWTDQDRELAAREGWRLDIDPEHGGLDILRAPNPLGLRSDAEARGYVSTRLLSSDPLAVRAIESIVLAQSPAMDINWRHEANIVQLVGMPVIDRPRAASYDFTAFEKSVEYMDRNSTDPQFARARSRAKFADVCDEIAAGKEFRFDALSEANGRYPLGTSNKDERAYWQADEQTLEALLRERQRGKSMTAAETKAPRAEAEQSKRQFIAVPFAEKDEAKSAGAKWSRAEKSWYIPEGADPAPFAKWTVKDKLPEPDLSPQKEFAQALKSYGLELDGDPDMDGKWHRVPVTGDKGAQKNGAYRGFLDGRPAGNITNYKSGTHEKWVAVGVALTGEDRARIQAEAAQVRADREAQRLDSAEKAAKVAYGIWANLPASATPETCPYLAGKGVGAHGVKVDGAGKLVIPARDADGKLWTVQFASADGKRWLKDSQKAGGMHVVEPTGKGTLDSLTPHGGAVVIAEGYATAARIFDATNRPVVVAFDSGNLLAVAEAVHAKFPDRPILLAADNDHANKLGNVGMIKAEEAAKNVGGYFFAPKFTPAEMAKGLTDFDDLGKARGNGAVRQVVEATLARINAPERSIA
ncbi:MAG: DUF1738 domain-containing protein [Rhodospirillaceae bacterium]|nr:DUF1738 domain-containing protein [Rhodospirillales bacterium]